MRAPDNPLRHGWLLAACLALAGCIEHDCAPAPGRAAWGTYADGFGPGSSARAEDFFGDLIVDLRKAASSEDRHPYAGLLIQIAPDRSGIDAAAGERLTIEYISSGPLTLALEQDGIPAERSFATTLPASPGARTVSLRIDGSTFRQPSWATSSDTLGAHRLVGFKFELQGRAEMSANVVLREVRIDSRNACIRRGR